MDSGWCRLLGNTGQVILSLRQPLPLLLLVPSPPLQSPPTPGGERSLGPKSIENTRRQRHQRQFLQGAEADLHFDTMPPPPLSFPTLVVPQGGLGDRHLVNPKFSLRLIVLLCG